MSRAIGAIGFEYEPIDDRSNNIRILTLLPGSWHEALRCLLMVVSLDSKPEYEALSYAWGSESSKKCIFVNDFEVNIFSNLEAALRHLRREDECLTIWADAVCIDQANIDEKTHQVGLMGDIYRNCTSVYIWLGLPNEVQEEKQSRNFRLKFHHTQKRRIIMKQKGDPPKSSTCIPKDVGRDKNEEADPYAVIRHFANNGHLYQLPGHRRSGPGGLDISFSPNQAFTTMWGHFSNSMQSTWWTRFWVVQECLLARKSTVVLGHWRIAWEDLKVAEENHRQHILTCCAGAWKVFPKQYAFYPDRLISDAKSITSQNSGENYQSFYDLDRILRAYRNRDCQNPLDKVFAILGLIDSSRYPSLRADYSLTVRQVYMHAMKTVIREKRGTLDFLTGSGFNSQQYALPSWVRNFAYCPDSKFLFHEMSRLSVYHLYSASSPRSAAEISMKADDSLCVKGICVDRVKAVGHAVRQMDLRYLMLTIMRWHLLAGIQPFWNMKVLDQRKQRAFWRTVLADVIPDDHSTWRRINSEDWEIYKQWLSDMRKALIKKLLGWKREPPFEAKFVKALVSAVFGRSLFITAEGHVGLCPAETRLGDEVWILHGGRVPFILRPSRAYVKDHGSESIYYRHIGDAYVDGLMDEHRDNIANEYQYHDIKIK